MKPELRRDPLSGRWVIFAPERALRPSELLPPDAPSDPGGCPFCEGHEHLTPPELLAVRPGPLPANGPGWLVRAFPNRYPALRTEERGDRSAEGFYDRMGGVGAHEVLVDSPAHQHDLADSPPAQIATLLAALRDRIQDLRRDTRLLTAVPFKNHGAAAGSTVWHSHTQLMALPLSPPEQRLELDHSERYHREKQRCLLCDIRQLEQRGGPRLVAQNHGMLALAPYAARVPFETWILPQQHASAFEELSANELEDLAQLLHSVLRRINRALRRPAYHWTIQSGPLRAPPLPFYHWHLKILPVLARLGGYEWASGSNINPTPPEEAAAFLRDLAPA